MTGYAKANATVHDYARPLLRFDDAAFSSWCTARNFGETECARMCRRSPFTSRKAEHQIARRQLALCRPSPSRGGSAPGFQLGRSSGSSLCRLLRVAKAAGSGHACVIIRFFKPEPRARLVCRRNGERISYAFALQSPFLSRRCNRHEAPQLGIIKTLVSSVVSETVLELCGATDIVRYTREENQYASALLKPVMLV